LLLREAPGHAVEESLFDVSQTVANQRSNGAIYIADPCDIAIFGSVFLRRGERKKSGKRIFFRLPLL
jgi:hypothetical protein